MPVERRIREGTRRNADVLDPDVDRALGSVVHATRRRALVHRSLAVVAVVPALVLAIVVGPRLLDARGSSTGVAAASSVPPSSVPPATVPPVASPLSGTFTRTLANDSAVVQVNGIAGRWSISDDADGEVRIVAPPSFAGAAISAPFEVQGDQLLTDAFSHDVCVSFPAGTYRWVRAGRFLVLTPVSDPCDARVKILASGPWTKRS